jgi:hypothetical protein
MTGPPGVSRATSRLGRREFVVGLVLLPLSVRATGLQPVDGEPARFPLRRDAEGRVLVEATIDGRGTCDLVVDTAATRSVLTPDAVERLGLEVLPGDGTLVHGITGARRLPVARVRSLAAYDARLADADVPIVPRFSVPGADGLLGTDALAGCTLTLDFAGVAMSISRTTRAQQAGGIVASHRLAGAVAVPSQLSGKAVAAIIDTGAARTLGTPSLASLCPSTSADATRRGSIRGVDLGLASTLECVLPALVLGSRRIQGVTVGFVSLPALDAWGLADEPALVLGIDVLGRLGGLRLDFASGVLSIA